MAGGFLVFALNRDANPADAMTLQLKGILARHLTHGREDARVLLHGSVRLPSLACNGSSVHRLMVSRAEVRSEDSASMPAEDPRQAIAALETARAARALDRAELERLRQLYWAIGDPTRSLEIARALFSAR